MQEFVNSNYSNLTTNLKKVATIYTTSAEIDLLFIIELYNIRINLHIWCLWWFCNTDTDKSELGAECSYAISI